MGTVTQHSAVTAKQSVVVYGQTYTLKKDATDAAVFFPHNRVKVEEYGCEQIGKDLYMVWISGVIPAAPGTLEKSLRVFYVGWSPIKIYKPTDRDILNMHVYTAETGSFAAEFAHQFLDRTDNTAADYSRAPVTPFPVVTPSTTATVDGTIPQAAVAETVNATPTTSEETVK